MTPLWLVNEMKTDSATSRNIHTVLIRSDGTAAGFQIETREYNIKAASDW